MGARARVETVKIAVDRKVFALTASDKHFRYKQIIFIHINIYIYKLLSYGPLFLQTRKIE